MKTLTKKYIYVCVCIYILVNTNSNAFEMFPESSWEIPQATQNDMQAVSTIIDLNQKAHGPLHTSIQSQAISHTLSFLSYSVAVTDTED